MLLERVCLWALTVFGCQRWAEISVYVPGSVLGGGSSENEDSKLF